MSSLNKQVTADGEEMNVKNVKKFKCFRDLLNQTEQEKEQLKNDTKN